MVDELRSHKTAMTYEWDKLNFCPLEVSHSIEPTVFESKYRKSLYTYDVGLNKNMMTVCNRKFTEE
jgi:hypothetical protein